MAITREAIVRSICPFSGETIMPGDRLTMYTRDQHEAFMSNINPKIPTCLLDHIFKDSNFYSKIDSWGLDCHTNWLAKKTASGRTIKPVLKQLDN